jgi:hypothetical protein
MAFKVGTFQIREIRFRDNTTQTQMRPISFEAILGQGARSQTRLMTQHIVPAT